MSRLWDDDEPDEIVEMSIQPLPRHQLVEMAPDQLVEFEGKQQESMIRQTLQFADQMKSCEKIVEAAYTVADYTPPFQNDLQSQFWTQTLIPILVKSLKQDAFARSTITKSFGSIRDLAITIQSVYQIVKQSKGSKKAVEIAQKNIPDALARLDKYIEDAESLDSVAINEFGEQSQQIFEIIGPEAAKFAEQKDQLEAKINKKYKEQDELYRELGIVQGKVNSAYYLMSASEKYLSGVQCDLDATKQRLNELNNMNMDVETTMKNIPQTRQRTIVTHNTVDWLFGKFTTTRTSTVTEKNPNREADLKYYNSLVAARKERINNNLADRNNREERTRIINADLARYKNDYQAAATELQGLQKNFNLQMNEINEEIEKLREDKKNLDKLEFAVVQKIGLQGNTLVMCLVHVRQFAKKLKPGASAYSPLVAILNGIKSMVKTNIDLLSSDRDEDIYLAGSLLIKQVEFLSNYTLQAQKTMQPSIEYDMDELTGKMKNNAITDE